MTIERVQIKKKKIKDHARLRKICRFWNTYRWGVNKKKWMYVSMIAWTTRAIKWMVTEIPEHSFKHIVVHTIH